MAETVEIITDERNEAIGISISRLSQSLPLLVRTEREVARLLSLVKLLHQITEAYPSDDATLQQADNKEIEALGGGLRRVLGQVAAMKSRRLRALIALEEEFDREEQRTHKPEKRVKPS
jgi:hypothetical protein